LYWGEALGGPTTYSDQYGDETSVVRIHSGSGKTLGVLRVVTVAERMANHFVR
jgi:hypothetical protein